MLKNSLTIVSFIVTVGCTSHDPTFGVLDQGAIPMLTFSGQTERTLSLNNIVTGVALRGECDPRVRAIDVVVLAVGTRGQLDVISVGSPQINCAGSRTFAATLKALQDLIPNAAANQKYVIEFRAETLGGMSNPSRLTLEYVRELPEPTRVTAGGSESPAAPGARASIAPHFRADLRVTNRVNAADAVTGDAVTRAGSPHFQMRVGRAGQTGP